MIKKEENQIEQSLFVQRLKTANITGVNSQWFTPKPSSFCISSAMMSNDLF